jgi:glutathione S-transferase
VYTRTVCFALAEKGVPYSYVEVNPFDLDADKSDNTVNPHPFNRVPTLIHGDLTIYETVAITRYVDEYFEGISLQPEDVSARGEMMQIISIIDSYGYWPMVRQVFSHRISRPQAGEPVNEEEVIIGLRQSAKVLGVLEQLTNDTKYLCGRSISLADIHIAPMMDYFQMTEEGGLMLSEFDSLSTWWEKIRQNSNFIAVCE